MLLVLNVIDRIKASQWLLINSLQIVHYNVVIVVLVGRLVKKINTS